MPFGYPDEVAVSPNVLSAPWLKCTFGISMLGVQDYICANCGGNLGYNGSNTSIYCCRHCKWLIKETWFSGAAAPQSSGSTTPGLGRSIAGTAAQTAQQKAATFKSYRIPNPRSSQPMAQPRANPNVRIWWDSQVSAYRMTTPYNPGFQELFKQLIPHSDRNWSDASKNWTFIEKYFDAVKTLIEKSFGIPTVITKVQTEKASQAEIKTAPIEKVMLEFFKVLPYEAAHKAYRHAALLLHPDRGGDMDKMSNLNACWQRLEADHYKKSS